MFTSASVSVQLGRWRSTFFFVIALNFVTQGIRIWKLGLKIGRSNKFIFFDIIIWIIFPTEEVSWLDAGWR